MSKNNLDMAMRITDAILNEFEKSGKLDVPLDEHKYSFDLQDVIEGDTMILELLNQSSPVIVKDPKDSTSLYILMPMRI